MLRTLLRSEQILTVSRLGDDSLEDRWGNIITIFGFHSLALTYDLKMSGTEPRTSSRVLIFWPLKCSLSQIEQIKIVPQLLGREFG